MGIINRKEYNYERTIQQTISNKLKRKRNRLIKGSMVHLLNICFKDKNTLHALSDRFYPLNIVCFNYINLKDKSRFDNPYDLTLEMKSRRNISAQ